MLFHSLPAEVGLHKLLHCRYHLIWTEAAHDEQLAELLQAVEDAWQQTLGGGSHVVLGRRLDHALVCV